MDVSIIAIGPAAPSRRLAAADVAAAWGDRGGRGHLAVCGPDEDALTLAWTAASRALAAASVDPGEVDGLWWGVGTPPFDQGPSLAYLAASLELADEVDGALTAGSRMSGIDALLAAWDAVAAGRVERALVVASDAPVPGRGSAYERQVGAGAVAFLLQADDVGPARLVRRTSLTRPHLDRYRGPGERTVRDIYDGRLFREEVFLPALQQVASTIAGDEAIASWSLPDPDGRLGGRLAKHLGVEAPASATVRRRLGDAGASAAPLGLAGCLATTGTGVALAQGDGRTIGLVVEVTAPVPGVERLETIGTDARDLSYAAALRARGQLVADDDPIEMAVPPGGAGFVRGNAELLGLHGARCEDCGAISTPPSVHPTCIGCGGDRLTEVPLARHGTVQTFVVNTTMPAPFEAPLPLLVVDLDDGARLMVHGAGVADEIAIGDEVELVLRRYALERGASIYGWKAAPVGTGPLEADGVVAPVDTHAEAGS